jgi:osmoprotectant transport system ATP-binding protein
VIRLEHLVKRYGDTLAVDDFSLDVAEGEVCVLIGPSGCGKTTTIRMINHLIQPTSGKIFIDAKDITMVKPERLRQAIGYAIQNVGLFPHMTVAANISVVPELLHWQKNRIACRVGELLTLVDLDPAEYGRKYPGQLSGGQAQRVGVARALAADPPILLMDEPFGAVDPLTRERLQAQFARIQKELRKTIILVTHDLNEAIRLADRIVIMESGKLVQYDTPEAILSKPANKFVHDFVGVDRALKRLLRIGVASFIKPAASVVVGISVKEAARVIGHLMSAWAVDGNGRLIGWIDGKVLAQATDLNQALVTQGMAELAILKSATLHEALSRMLGQGVRSVPVCDDERRLIGEVTLADIETATAEVEG